MNKESANTILKFLEEPTGDIIGFFITNHSDNVMPTIQSRCQLIEELFENNEYTEIGLSKEDYDLHFERVCNYLKKIELEKKKLIIYNKDFFDNLEKENIKYFFQIMLNIYQTILINKELFIKKYSELSFLMSYSTKNIIKKINLIIEFLGKINYNVNVDLLLDKFVIEMEGINHETL